MTEQKKSRIILHREINLEADETKLVDDIEKYGCHIIHVKPQQPIPGWSYTIGLYETWQQPELIVVGMKQDSAHYLLNEAALRMKQGLRLAGGHREKDLLENVECEFRKVEQHWAQHVMGYALWRSRRVPRQAPSPRSARQTCPSAGADAMPAIISP